jgi:hypothetical protein
MGRRYTPYSVSMAKKLKEKLPNVQLRIDVDGKSGQTVTLHYRSRMEKNFSGQWSCLFSDARWEARFRFYLGTISLIFDSFSKRLDL